MRSTLISAHAALLLLFGLLTAADDPNYTNCLCISAATGYADSIVGEATGACCLEVDTCRDYGQTVYPGGRKQCKAKAKCIKYSQWSHCCDAQGAKGMYCYDVDRDYYGSPVQVGGYWETWK